MVLLGKYRVEQVLGQGGMGTVVRARHLSLDEAVAIKVLNSELALSTELAQRFVREARATARLRSRHAVRVTDVGELDDGTPYMVMEMLEGTDLAQLARAHGAFAPAVAVGLVLQVCDVLAEAHGHGIVHRDIKPSNLFATTGDDGAPFIKLLDFGIAKAAEPDGAPITRTRSILGTPGYMSPEQLRSARAVDHRADLWALGAVLYELLEGRRAFDAESFADLCVQITAAPTPPLVRAPPALAGVVRRCLEKAPEQRYPSVDELARALAPFSADPAAAARDLERMQRRARAGVERPAEPTPPRGRLDAPTAAPADAGLAPAAASSPLAPPPREPAAPTVSIATAATQAPAPQRRDLPAPPAPIATASSPRAPVRMPRRRAGLAVSTAVLVAIAGIALAWRLRATPRRRRARRAIRRRRCRPASTDGPDRRRAGAPHPTAPRPDRPRPPHRSQRQRRPRRRRPPSSQPPSRQPGRRASGRPRRPRRSPPARRPPRRPTKRSSSRSASTARRSAAAAVVRTGMRRPRPPRPPRLQPRAP